MIHREVFYPMVSTCDSSLILSVRKQVTSVPLTPEILCQKDEATYKLARKALLKVISPLAQIAQFESKNRIWNSTKYITLANFKQQEPRYDGFTKEQILEHCLNFFANETAKVTIEFLDTDVMQIKRDTRFTIMDQIGIIGDTICNNFCNNAYNLLNFRWRNWPIYRILNNQHC